MIAGADGYKKGWIAAVDLGSEQTAVRCYATFRELLADEQLTHIAIDIPIGLLDRGARACDQEARRLLGRARASSVFPAPIRAMLKARSWEEACRILFTVEGKKCSKQLWGILPKIREVDALMTPELQERVRETHPEVSFALMNGGKAMTYRKATREGRSERLRLLERYCPDVTKHLSEIPGAPTDIIDAYACLWTARRIMKGEARSVYSINRTDQRDQRDRRDQAERDAKGLKAEIVGVPRRAFAGDPSSFPHKRWDRIFNLEVAPK